jgi:hypothetical protein
VAKEREVDLADRRGTKIGAFAGKRRNGDKKPWPGRRKEIGAA